MRIVAVILGGIALTVMTWGFIQASNDDSGVTLAGGVKTTNTPEKKATKTPEKKDATSTPEKKATNTPEKKDATNTPEKKDATSTPEKKATNTPEKKDATSTPEKKDTATATPVSKGNACSPGFWKNKEEAWDATNYDPDDTLGSVFDIPGEFSSIAGDSLHEALSYGGGPSDLDAAKNLLHHAVAALLNSTHPGIDYPLDEADIISDVNDALDSSDRSTMLGLKDSFGEEGCPIDD
jgi:hypothetical protein